MRGYRFRDDWQSPASKLDSVEHLLGSAVVQIVTLTQPQADAHSTLTGTTQNPEAVAEIRTFLLDRLTTTA